MLNGKKTYITALVSILYAGWGLYSNTLPAADAFNIIQMALIGAFIRNAV